jgi:hypothetical protein
MELALGLRSYHSHLVKAGSRRRLFRRAVLGKDSKELDQKISWMRKIWKYVSFLTLWLYSIYHCSEVLTDASVAGNC